MNLLAPLAVLVWGALAFVGVLVFAAVSGSAFGLLFACVCAGLAYAAQLTQLSYAAQFNDGRAFEVLQVASIAAAGFSVAASFFGA